MKKYGLLDITISWAKWGASGSAKRWANLVRDDLTPGWTVKVDACATHLSTIENIWDEKIESKSPSPDSDSNCDWLDKWECFAESSSTIPSECIPQRGDPLKRSSFRGAWWYNLKEPLKIGRFLAPEIVRFRGNLTKLYQRAPVNKINIDSY